MKELIKKTDIVCVNASGMCDEICKDFSISRTYKFIQKFEKFPIKDGKRDIHAHFNSIIVDKYGNEYPYMKDKNQRNNEKLLSFDYIYTIKFKDLFKILDELKLTLKTENVNICEGGGWYSKGKRYYYKNFYCEL